MANDIYNEVCIEQLLKDRFGQDIEVVRNDTDIIELSMGKTFIYMMLPNEDDKTLFVSVNYGCHQLTDRFPCFLGSEEEIVASVAIVKDKFDKFLKEYSYFSICIEERGLYEE